ncbi:hypothetical protein [Tichowtungia aerotolerans]|uniref:Uncharacterized protein n=1 Tax=Tichowtungia aerotolerans TaxID=2697043 RepID=A0A6P1M7C2_9BACT|nr:hypothetical protein [Tichowtungia aerotolerans]QHI69932.1 hypothetical protein GT409_10875 [Tichowtungia aerotolerans]
MINVDALISLEQTTDGGFHCGRGEVVSVKTPDDRKVEFVTFEDGRQLALVNSAMGYPAYYPVQDVKIEKPLKAVLMDLDGTTVHSEHFWIWIIEKTTASLQGDSKFRLEAARFRPTGIKQMAGSIVIADHRGSPDMEIRVGENGCGWNRLKDKVLWFFHTQESSLFEETCC